MGRLRVLHLEDNADDAFLVRRALEEAGLEVDIQVVASSPQFLAALHGGGFDLILADKGLPGFGGSRALEMARETCRGVPFLFVSGAGDPREVAAAIESGAAGYVLKDELERLPAAIGRAREATARASAADRLERDNHAMKRLVAAVQELSLARDLPTLMDVVRRAARELTGADGATFILRDGDQCHYADENAIGPLWKGQRFPMSACISGWAMLNRQPAVIEDIYVDPRIPVEAYRPTFVKSLVMVPIRVAAPIGAIGNYWARRHLADPSEVELLQALANTTAVAMESVRVLTELEQRVRDRTVALEAANRELETFSYSVSHDLRGPLRRIDGFASLLARERAVERDEKSQRYVGKVRAEIGLMGTLIDDLLRLSRLASVELTRRSVDLSALAAAVVEQLRAGSPERRVETRIAPHLVAWGDPGLLRVVVENLLSNAWKYTGRRDSALVEVGSAPQADGSDAFFVRDNGAGFDMQYAGKLFAPFQRMHSQEEFSGNGVGLATVQRVVHRHGGRIWAEAELDRGATFYFTLPPAPADR